MRRFLSTLSLVVAFITGLHQISCEGAIITITSGASANNRQNFDVATDQFLLDTNVFPIAGPLVFANAVGGNPGQFGVADNSNTFASDANFIVLRNFDNNDTNGFPANWDNSFNARRALEAIAANTDGDRPGFFFYWNEGLGVNRLAYTANLNNGAASLQILFAQNSANLVSNTVDLRDGGANVNLRAEANANFNLLSSFTASNVSAVPEPSSLACLSIPMAFTFLRRARASRRS